MSMPFYKNFLPTYPYLLIRKQYLQTVCIVFHYGLKYLTFSKNKTEPMYLKVRYLPWNLSLTV
jgi:hypothetical protein